MSTEKKLIGFYRENNIIQPIYHSKNTFFDINMQKSYKAVVVPLQFFSNSVDWTLSAYSNFLDQATSTFFNYKTVWLTTVQPTSIFYTLMYTDFTRRDMCRSGVLLIKHDNDYFPLKVAYNNQEFLIEIKGIGSPIGLFPSIHYRNQAGCFNSSHTRITGSLLKQEALDEFNMLERREKELEKLNVTSHIKPLAVTTFEYADVSMGQLVRLVPSTIRASFTKHPVFDELMTKNKTKAYFCMGQEVSTNLNFSQPIHHQNLALNNMVYVTPTSYALTDWSESSFIYDTQKTQDYPLCLYPIVYFASKFTKSDDFSAYIKGIKSLQSSYSIQSLSNESHLQLNEQLLSSHGFSYYTYISKNHYDFSNIITIYNYYIQLFTISYNEHSTTSWIQTYLLPFLNCNLECLNYLMVSRKKMSKPLFFETINLIKNKESNPYIKKIFKLNPFLKIAIPSKKKSTSSFDPNAYASPRTIFNNLLPLLNNVSTHKSIIKKHKDLIEQLHQFLSDPSSLTFSQQDYLNFKFLPTTLYLQFLIYPYYFTMMSFCTTQQYFLKGALKEASLKQDIDAINKLLGHFNSIISNLESNPEMYRSAFTKNASSFIESLNPF